MKDIIHRGLCMMSYFIIWLTIYFDGTAQCWSSSCLLFPSKSYSDQEFDDDFPSLFT